MTDRHAVRTMKTVKANTKHKIILDKTSSISHVKTM